MMSSPEELKGLRASLHAAGKSLPSGERPGRERLPSARPLLLPPGLAPLQFPALRTPGRLLSGCWRLPRNIPLWTKVKSNRPWPLCPIQGSCLSSYPVKLKLLDMSALVLSQLPEKTGLLQNHHFRFMGLPLAGVSMRVEERLPSGKIQTPPSFGFELTKRHPWGLYSSCKVHIYFCSSILCSANAHRSKNIYLH